MHLGPLELRGGVFEIYAQQQDALCSGSLARARVKKPETHVFFIGLIQISLYARACVCGEKEREREKEREILSSRNVKDLEERIYKL